MPSPDERLAHIRTKLDRAKHHLDDLNDAHKRFLETDPYVVVTDHDPQTGKRRYRVGSLTETPIALTVTAGDALQCMRSALDHLAYQLVLLGSGKPTKKTQFPIVDYAKDYKSVRNKSLEGMRDDAKRAIDAARPYADEGGDIALWRLYRLNNIDKHRSLLTISAVSAGIDIGADMWHRCRDGPLFAGFDVFHYFAQSEGPVRMLNVGDVLFTGTPDDEPNPHMQFPFAVALHEPGVVEGEPLIGLLTGVFDRVNRLMDDFRPFLA